MKRIAILALACGLLLCSAPNVYAEGFAIYEWGARGSALANGMVGRADDASAVAHNPAGITQLKGKQVMVGGAIITPKMIIDTRSAEGTNHNRVMRHYHFVPHGFYTHQINDSVWFGFGAFTRYGLGNDYPDGWDGRYNLKDVKLKTISLNPNVAFKLTDNLSFAVGIEAMTARMTMHKISPLPSIGDSYQEINGHNNCAVGVNAAIHYKFNEQWSAGLTYRSAVTHNVKGDTAFQASSSMASMYNSNVKGHLRMPDHFSAGVAYKPMENLSFEVGAVYTVWSRFRNFNIQFSNPIPAISSALTAAGTTPRDWKDTWLFNVSVEYLPVEWLALRAGYSYETSPIPAGRADYMVETNGRSRYSCGVGFMFDDWTIDLAYTMFRSNELDYCSSQFIGLQNGGVYPGRSHHGITHSGTVSVGYKF